MSHSEYSGLGKRAQWQMGTFQNALWTCRLFDISYERTCLLGMIQETLHTEVVHDYIGFAQI